MQGGNLAIFLKGLPNLAYAQWILAINPGMGRVGAATLAEERLYLFRASPEDLGPRVGRASGGSVRPPRRLASPNEIG
jgi:hypothetical protein